MGKLKIMTRIKNGLLIQLMEQLILHGVHICNICCSSIKRWNCFWVIFDPIKNEMFYAKNNGAFFNNQRIRVSKKNNIKDYLLELEEN